MVPQSLEDARKTGNFAPWVDHRLSMERVVTRFFSHLSRTIHQMDPLARVGFDSPVPHHWSALDEKTAFQSGYNYPDLIRSLDGLVIYDQKCERELIRSLARPGFYYSEWWGLHPHPKGRATALLPWRMLLSGAQSSCTTQTRGARTRWPSATAASLPSRKQGTAGNPVGNPARRSSPPDVSSTR